MNEDSSSELMSSDARLAAAARLQPCASSEPEQQPALLVPGETCWRIETADRVAVLIDAADYFSALRRAILAARSHVVIVGWDVDSRTRLAPGKRAPDGLPTTLLPFLKAALRRRPQLQVYIVAWDFSVIYALEREFLPSFTFSHAHPRLHFVLDSGHALGASQHQKLVVIDDQLAFVGGIDLTIRRWDSAAHRNTNAQRVDPHGEPYGPMHDVQLCLDGAAARALAELAWNRWQHAHARPASETSTTNAVARRATPEPADLWPAWAPVDFVATPIAVCRTHAGTLEVPKATREIEVLTRTALTSARDYVYIENQYLTSAVASAALRASLSRPEGPEVIIVLPKVECGWLEQSSMGVLRQRTLQQLRAADQHGRLHLYYPRLADETATSLNVHSKLLIVDGAFFKVGSANLSNRSLGLDTECDVAIEARGRGAERTRTSITAILQRLLAEHLDLRPSDCAAHVASGKSLVAFIEAQRGRARCLAPLPETTDAAPLDLGALGELVVDPERPMAAETFIQGMFPADLRHPALRTTLASLVLLLPVLVLSLLRHVHGDNQTLQSAIVLFREPAQAWPWLAASYALGCLLFVPISVLLATTAVLLPPLAAFTYGVAGALLGAMLAYAIGRIWRRPTLRYLRQRPAWQLYRSLHERALRATLLARLLPVGNFTGSNLLAGALSLRFWRFMLGNMIGLSLGVAWLVLFAQQLTAAWREPSWQHVTICGAIASSMLGLCFALAHAFATPHSRSVH